MHLMAFGMFVFDLGSLPFDELQRKSDWQHASSPRIGARDVSQYTGPGAETISLSGSVYAEIADGRVSIDQLRMMADAGDAMPLIGGNGMIYGQFVITAIDERHAELLPDGTARRIDFGIDLLRIPDPAQPEPANVQTPVSA